MNSSSAERVRLTQYSHGAGCACKLGPTHLASALAALRGGMAADVLVGLDAPDDAAVYALNADLSIVSTLDFFTPIVDDPYTFGAIAAANALSDVYAMGGRPLFALNIVAFPADLDVSILMNILRGGRDKAQEAGVSVVGGHSIDDREPKYGMAVIGSAERDRIYRKSDGRPGDRLVLGKALGTGVISTAIKRGSAADDHVAAAVDSMTQLNRDALELARRRDVGAITDVTGYGLLGHLSDLARLSGLSAIVVADQVPLLPGAFELAVAGNVPGGTRRNCEHVEAQVAWPDGLDETTRALLCDPQTSGGLLITVDAADVDALVRELTDAGYAAAEIGELRDGPAGTIEVRSR